MLRSRTETGPGLNIFSFNLSLIGKKCDYIIILSSWSHKLLDI